MILTIKFQNNYRIIKVKIFLTELILSTYYAL
jgi:hypothetical protein